MEGTEMIETMVAMAIYTGMCLTILDLGNGCITQITRCGIWGGEEVKTVCPNKDLKEGE